MKVILTICLVSCLTLLACNSPKRHNTSISIKDNGNELNFKAIYPEEKTAVVQGYIESNLKEERIFSATSDIKKVAIKLRDGTLFYLNYEPGFLAINFDRSKNSFSSYSRMKKMIAGFGKAIKD